MKIFAFFTIFIFLNRSAYAEENNWDYQQVLQGDIVPYDGYLFSQDGMINLVTKVESKIKKLENDKDKEKKIIIIDYETIIKNKQSELTIKEEMYNKQLNIKQQTINSYANQTYWNTVKIVSYSLAGIGLGIIVGKYILQ